MRHLSVGILSTARINERSVFDVVPGIPDVSVVAVASRSATRARDYARRFAVPKWYGSYEDLLLDREVDAVYIPLPNALHVGWTLRALAEGKHVLCEKPVTGDPSLVDSIEEEAHKRHLWVKEAMHYRSHPDIKRAVSLIHSGCVGDIELVRVRFVGDRIHDRDIRGSAPLDGGALMDAGCYCLDLVRWVTQDDAPTVTSAESSWSETNVDVITAATLTCSGGAAVELYCGLTGPAFSCSAEVSGSKGSVILNCPFLPAVRKGAQVETLFSFEAEGLQNRATPPRRRQETSYFFQLVEFRDAVYNGEAAAGMLSGARHNARLISQIKSVSRVNEHRYRA